jgi:type IV pilus assembly protein PilM
MPRELVQVKTIRLPSLPESEMRAAIETEARTLFTSAPENLSIRFIPAGEVRQGAEVRQEVIVLAVETAAIEQLLEQFSQAGLIVDSLDFEPSSMYRGIERFVRRKEDENEVSVLVDIGAGQSQVVIGRGRDVTFVKAIDIGGQKISDCVARKLGLSLSEAASLRRRFASTPSTEKDPVRQTVLDATRSMISDLAHEVSLCLRYYSVTFRGQRPSKLRLLGGEANDPTIRTAMSQSLAVPVEVYQPFHGITTAHTQIDTLEGSLGEWGVCFGAALRAVRNQVSRNAVANPAFGRRKSDAAVVEVVDLTTAIKTAGVMETADPRRTRNEEVSHA